MRLYLLLLTVFLFFNCNDTKDDFIALDIYGCGKFYKRIDNKEIINKFEKAIKNSKINDIYLKYRTDYTIYAFKNKDTIVFHIDEDLFIKNRKTFISKRDLFKILEIEKCEN
ncbi:hypothetical protein [Mariniflexile sp. HMF6888]|uniref:hypothetical protein n=1 Tax=Mariniflexile sp. HMF6888 TaxID=3373086 RepID=UPI00378D74D9